MAVVTFDPQVFREAYPRFVDPKSGTPLLTDAQLEQAFDVACLLLDNTDASPVPYDPAHGIMIRKTFLYLLVCHLATLALWPAGQSGPTSSATEGSVTVAFSIPQNAGKAFYAQTPWVRPSGRPSNPMPWAGATMPPGIGIRGGNDARRTRKAAQAVHHSRHHGEGRGA